MVMCNGFDMVSKGFERPLSGAKELCIHGEWGTLYCGISRPQWHRDQVPVLLSLLCLTDHVIDGLPPWRFGGEVGLRLEE